jgi:hypothetical protein
MTSLCVQGANGKQAIIRKITMDLICNQLKGKVVATAQRIQKKYEKKLERQRNGRKAVIDTSQARDLSAGSLRSELRVVNEKRWQKAEKKKEVARNKTVRIQKKAVAAQKVYVTTN